jgi:hypothetical protein
VTEDPGRVTEDPGRVTEDPGRAAWLREARSHLRGADPVLSRLIDDRPGDLALRKAVRAADQLDHLPSQQEVSVIAEKWRPYRSLATSYLFSAAFGPANGERAAEGDTAVAAGRPTLP